MTATAAKPEGKTLNAGDKAPDFTAPANGGKEISLSACKGKKVVLYFYPKDDTPGCTVEAKDFRDHIKEFEKANTLVLGVSKDSVMSHGKFQEKFCLPFPLVSDEKTSICEDYGVWVQKSMYGKTYMGIERTTFLIDEKGAISHVWRKVKVDGHVKEVLEAAKAS